MCLTVSFGISNKESALFFSNMFFCHLQTFPTRTVVVQFSHGNSSQKCPALRSVIYNLPRTKIQDHPRSLNIHSFQKFKNWSANLSNGQHGVFRLCIYLHMYIYIYLQGIILPRYIGIMTSHYKDRYEPISVMECHKDVEHCSCSLGSPLCPHLRWRRWRNEGLFLVSEFCGWKQCKEFRLRKDDVKLNKPTWSNMFPVPFCCNK